jgi:hypothetical protein
MPVNKLVGLAAALFLLACSVGSTPDPAPRLPLDAANTSRAAAARALRTLKGSVRKENAQSYGFRDPEEAQTATLVELGLTNKRLDTRRLSIDSADESALIEQGSLETWAYRTPRGAVGQILVREANGTWAPMAIGSTLVMEKILATVALIKARGGVPTAIVRTQALPEIFVQYELNGKSRLVEAERKPLLGDSSLNDSLRAIANSLKAGGEGPRDPEE